MEQRLQGLEASNARKLEEMRKALAESLAAMQAQNAQKLDEIRHTVDEQLQDALQKAGDRKLQGGQRPAGAGVRAAWVRCESPCCGCVGGLKQVLSGVKTRGILGEIQLGAILKKFWRRSSTTPTWPHPRQHPAGGVRHQNARC